MDSRPGLVVRSLGGASLAVFSGLRGTDFWGALLGQAFLEAFFDPVSFLLPVGVEPEAWVRGAVRGVPMLEAGGITVTGVRVTWIGLLAQVDTLDSDFNNMGTVDFLDELAVGGRG